ncbi:MAG: NUDIX hydrolase [Actinomycetota bacterium]
MDFALCSGSQALAPSDDRETARRALGDARGTGFDEDRQRILELVDAHDDIAIRTCRPGHLTGSAFVIDPSRNAALLLFHTKLQKWLQPGGHADGDTNLAAVAWREATEETGIDGLEVVTPAIDIDIHEVDPPAEDAHLHLDVRFLVLTPPGAEPVGNHESQGFRWVTPDALASGDYEAGLQRMGAAAFSLAERISDRSR